MPGIGRRQRHERRIMKLGRLTRRQTAQPKAIKREDHRACLSAPARAWRLCRFGVRGIAAQPLTPPSVIPFTKLLWIKG